MVPPRRSSHARRLERASLISSNWTGRPVFCCMTIARVRISGPRTKVPILILTRSQPRNLLSIARSKSARSRSRRSRSRKNRISHICRHFSGRFVPTFLPAFQARQSGVAGSCENVPFRFSFGHDWPLEERPSDWIGAGSGTSTFGTVSRSSRRFGVSFALSHPQARRSGASFSRPARRRTQE